MHPRLLAPSSDMFPTRIHIAHTHQALCALQGTADMHDELFGHCLAALRFGVSRSACEDTIRKAFEMDASKPEVRLLLKPALSFDSLSRACHSVESMGCRLLSSACRLLVQAAAVLGVSHRSPVQCKAWAFQRAIAFPKRFLKCKLKAHCCHDPQCC